MNPRRDLEVDLVLDAGMQGRALDQDHAPALVGLDHLFLLHVTALRLKRADPAQRVHVDAQLLQPLDQLHGLQAHPITVLQIDPQLLALEERLALPGVGSQPPEIGMRHQLRP